jgi:hypothetical protein
MFMYAYVLHDTMQCPEILLSLLDLDPAPPNDDRFLALTRPACQLVRRSGHVSPVTLCGGVTTLLNRRSDE